MPALKMLLLAPALVLGLERCAPELCTGTIPSCPTSDPSLVSKPDVRSREVHLYFRNDSPVTSPPPLLPPPRRQARPPRSRLRVRPAGRRRHHLRAPGRPRGEPRRVASVAAPHGAHAARRRMAGASNQAGPRGQPPSAAGAHGGPGRGARLRLPAAGVRRRARPPTRQPALPPPPSPAPRPLPARLAAPARSPALLSARNRPR